MHSIQSLKLPEELRTEMEEALITLRKSYGKEQNVKFLNVANLMRAATLIVCRDPKLIKLLAKTIFGTGLKYGPPFRVSHQPKD